MSRGAMNLTSLLYVVRTLERPLLFLIWWLLAAISTVLMISPIYGVDLPIFFLLWGPLAARLKKSNPGLRSLYAYICNCE
jgi:hypothetical protein